MEYTGINREIFIRYIKAFPCFEVEIITNFKEL